MAYNKPINSLAPLAGTQTRRAASLFCPTRLRPLLGRYMPMRNIIRLLTIFSLFAPLSAVAGSWYEVEGSQTLKFHKPTFEESMWDFVIKNTDTKFEDRKKYSFKYQVKGSVVLVHAYCDITVSEIRSQSMFLPLDGGSCYFEVQ